MYNLVLYILMYVLSFHLVMDGDDWFLIWLGLEINMIMFIILIYKHNDMMSSECCLKYFFIQSLGSGVFMGLLYLGVSHMKDLLVLMMSYKIGAGPFFFWFPSFCSGITWFSCFVLLTLQKIMPLFLMNMFISNVMLFVVLVSLGVGVFGSFNQLNLKQLLAYSSVFHLGWIIMCNMTYDLSWLIYMIMYMLLLIPLIYFLNFYNMIYILEIMKVKGKGYFVFLMLSMAGMPPLLGFFVKWFALNVLFNLSFYIMVLLVLMSVVMFYVYFRLLYDMLLAGFSEGLWVSGLLKYNESVWVDLLSMMGLFLSMVMVFMLF